MREMCIRDRDKYGTSIPCEQLSLFQEYSDRIRVDVYKRQQLDNVFLLMGDSY